MMPRRFVILHHILADGEHWDLMLEGDTALFTWQLLREPKSMASLPIPAKRIGDHRKAYLDYEGAVSGNRGHVRRVDRGACEIETNEHGLVAARLSGARVAGRVSLTADGDEWILDATE